MMYVNNNYCKGSSSIIKTCPLYRFKRCIDLFQAYTSRNICLNAVRRDITKASIGVLFIL